MSMPRFALAGMLAFSALLSFTASSGATTIIGSDDFDGGGVYVSRTISPDLSGNTPPGSFPGSRFDVWGIVDRNVNFDFADDSAGSFPADTFGILKTGKTDNVFGAEDLTNPDNLGGTGTASWIFDISGYTLNEMLIDFAAMGDFETANDSFVFSYSVDGSAFTDLYVSSVREDIDQVYTLESGTAVTLDDPLAMNGIVLNNNFQTLAASLAGLTGTQFTLRLNGTSDGGSEVFAFDNVKLYGTVVPEPSSVVLMGLGVAGAGFAATRRRRARVS